MCGQQAVLNKLGRYTGGKHASWPLLEAARHSGWFGRLRKKWLRVEKVTAAAACRTVAVAGVSQYVELAACWSGVVGTYMVTKALCGVLNSASSSQCWPLPFTAA
jgi:hypothetical protein